MRPLGPEPFPASARRSTPLCSAMTRASGDAFTSFASPDEGEAGAGAGAGGCAEGGAPAPPSAEESARGLGSAASPAGPGAAPRPAGGAAEAGAVPLPSYFDRSTFSPALANIATGVPIGAVTPSP